MISSRWIPPPPCPTTPAYSVLHTSRHPTGAVCASAAPSFVVAALTVSLRTQCASCFPPFPDPATIFLSLLDCTHPAPCLVPQLQHALSQTHVSRRRERRGATTHSWRRRWRRRAGGREGDDWYTQERKKIVHFLARGQQRAWLTTQAAGQAGGWLRQPWPLRRWLSKPVLLTLPRRFVRPAGS